MLGPPLFDVFIDDIDDYAELIELLIKFADDTKGMQSIRGPEDRDRLQRTLDRLMDWAKEWGMSFNLDKCKIMHVGNNNPNFKYTMGGRELVEVEEEKDIGVIVHKSLKPTRQCHSAARIAGAVLQQLVRNFHYRDRHVFRKLYIQYVRPHLEFATPAWAPWTKADIKVLEQVQVKAVGMVSGLVGTTYEERCEEIGLDTLERRRERQDLVLAHKVLNDSEEWAKNMFHMQPDRQGMTTRGAADKHTLVVQRARLDLRKHSFTIRAAESWNKLGLRAKEAGSVQAFKNAI